MINVWVLKENDSGLSSLFSHVIGSYKTLDRAKTAMRIKYNEVYDENETQDYESLNELDAKDSGGEDWLEIQETILS